MDYYTITQVLHKKTVFRYFESFPKHDLSFIYSPAGFYQEVTHNEQVTLIYRIFTECKVRMPSLIHTENICRMMRCGPNAMLGDPIYDTQHIAFTNGVLNIKTRKLGPWYPEIFLTYRLSYDFKEDAKAF